MKTSGGCADSLSQTITIGNPPVVNLVFTGDTVLAAGDSVIVSVQGTTDSLQWSTGSKSSYIIIKNAGNYWVKAFLGGCYIQKYFTVRTAQFGSDPVITTLFTPNGDGFNDRWAKT